MVPQLCLLLMSIRPRLLVAGCRCFQPRLFQREKGKGYGTRVECLHGFTPMSASKTLAARRSRRRSSTTYSEPAWTRTRTRTCPAANQRPPAAALHYGQHDGQLSPSPYTRFVSNGSSDMADGSWRHPSRPAASRSRRRPPANLSLWGALQEAQPTSYSASWAQPRCSLASLPRRGGPWPPEPRPALGLERLPETDFSRFHGPWLLRV